MLHTGRLRTATSAVAIAALTVLAGLSSSTPALAAPTADASTPTATASPATTNKTVPPGPSERLCGETPDPGYATCLSLIRTDVSGPKGLLAPGTSPVGYGPTDLRDAYNLPSVTAGAGEIVAIVDAFDDPTAEADLAIYRAQYGLPPCTTANGCFRKVDQRGGTSYPAPSAKWAGEISVDVDMVSAICPLCHILLIETDDNTLDNLYAGMNEAVALGAKYVSNSYGGPETPGQTTDDEDFFNHPGVVITASSGDAGFGVSYPATSRYITAVGGTSLTPADNARGWDEEAWSGAGSGCSRYDTKPAFQHDPDCSMRTVADVSAVADPNTGVAAYDTYSQAGWLVFGGTSVSAPIIASAYALANRVNPTDYPNSYPYATPSAFHDITVGSNGSCGENYQCTAKIGYDGPTGLGTPDGVLGFGESGPHGVITGTVTDTASGDPLADAQVTAGDISTTTDAQGHYTLALPVGSYDMTATAFGYGTSSASGVSVTDGGTTTQDFALAEQPTVTISGTITDGSGHAWPLYSAIELLNTPLHAVFTDPFTGTYQVTVPANATYTLQVIVQYPGYQPDRVQVQVGTSDVTHDIAVPVEPVACTAPGYGYTYTGLAVQTFDGGAVPTGWSVTDATGGGPWAFDDPGNEGNHTGGSGGFAIVDSDFYGPNAAQDTSLTTPTIDLSAVSAPVVGFNTDFFAFIDSVADVDVSIDDGSTWTNVWHRTTNSVRGPVVQTVPIPQAAGQANVRVRFRYQDAFGFYWAIDNVYVGERGCGPTVSGGLVAGQVTDANTGNPVTGATVASADQPANTTTSAATPDPGVGDGFYWLFAAPGTHSLTASKTAYQSVTGTAGVTANAVSQANLALKAGHIALDTGTVSATQTMGTSTTHPVTITNDGTAPATVTLSETGGGSGTLTQQGAPLQQVTGTFSPLSVIADPPSGGGTASPDTWPHTGPWAPLADYPTTLMDNAVGVAANGKVYSFGGVQGASGAPAPNAVYDPTTQTWTPITAMTTAREKPSVAYVGGKFYLFGGWNLTTGAVVATTEVYDPATDTWTSAATNPRPHAATAATVVGTTVYLVGGCDQSRCGTTDVMAYHPTTNTWSQARSYPQPISWTGCGTITGKVYCAGGNTGFGATTKGYSFDPATNAWTAIADLPVDDWGMGAAGADGLLLITGGVTNGSSSVSNQGFAYDPTVGAWTNLPNANHAVYRAGAACGLNTVGGSVSNFNAVAQGNILPGFDGCDGTANVTWLSEDTTQLTLQPGASTTITATFDAGTPTLSQPVTYNAELAIGTDTPYQIDPITLTMNVTAPAAWSRVIGTVVGVDCSGSLIPLAGSTIRASMNSSVFTINTDDTSNYGLWLADPPGLLTVTATKAGWQPETVSTQVDSGELVVTIFLSAPTTSCS